ncbi:MAG TPA: AbrB/MazE/SpoVT family DNA-binding domain-containing protein [Burkholderiaceae bacterium]|nr:AbrB/MazE/SpoVT family DNA-binding domain-containing protein [Burkholderiaceae bacterium]
MLAKITSKNQLTLPKAAVEAVGVTEYFDVQVRDGQIVLTPVRIQRGDAVRAKLAALGLGEGDVASAVRWARSSAAAPRVAEPQAPYGPARGRAKPVAKKKSTRRS